MALEEWEILPDDGFLEIHDDGGKKIFSRKYVDDPKSMFHMNYFICPSPKSAEFVEQTEQSGVPKQLLHLPIQLEPNNPDHEVVKEINQVPFEISVMPSAISDKIKVPPDIVLPQQVDQDTISQVFFKKMKESEKFADMKMGSPRSNNNMVGAMPPQLDPIAFQLPSNNDSLESENGKKNMGGVGKSDEEVSWEENSGNMNMWKWSLTGIGAICSFGVAAATVCIIFFGGRHKNKQHNHQHNQKLQFHIYTDDKKIKRVVRHATRLNEALSAATGVPIARAHFTLGGYCEGY